MRRGLVASGRPGPVDLANIVTVKNILNGDVVTPISGMADPHYLFFFYGQSTLTMNGVTVPRNSYDYAIVPVPAGDTVTFGISNTVAGRYQVAMFQVDGPLSFVEVTPDTTASMALVSDRLTQTVAHNRGDVVVARGWHHITNNDVVVYGSEGYLSSGWQSVQASGFGLVSQTGDSDSTTLSVGKTSNSYSGSMFMRLLVLRKS